jgi:hypothetical protein
MSTTTTTVALESLRACRTNLRAARCDTLAAEAELAGARRAKHAADYLVTD